MASEHVLELNDSNFDSTVASSPAILVDFWAPWCGPCRMIASALEEIATEMKGKVKVVKLNIDENPTVASKLGIRSIPTLILFKGGQEAARVVGAHGKDKIAAQIVPHL